MYGISIGVAHRIFFLKNKRTNYITHIDTHNMLINCNRKSTQYRENFCNKIREVLLQLQLYREIITHQNNITNTKEDNILYRFYIEV